MTEEEASAIALQALAWMAGEDDMLRHFSAATGVDPADLAARLGEVELQAAALDFLMLDDAWLLRFSAATGIAPDRPGWARQVLPGGALPHWT